MLGNSIAEAVNYIFCFYLHYSEKEKINTVYKEKSIASELGLVIGAITDSQKLIDQALKSEQGGGQIYMCKALEELRQEGIKEGIQLGEERGEERGIQIGEERGEKRGIRLGEKRGRILASIEIYRRIGWTDEAICQELLKGQDVTEQEIREYLEI